MQFTTHNLSVNSIIEILGMTEKDFIQSEKGMLGYKQMLVGADGGIKILYEGNENMGNHVIISGAGCRYLETIQDLIPFIHTVNYYNTKFTRIDLALDDKKGIITMKKLKKHLNNGWTKSRFKTYDILERRKLIDGNIKGNTIYIGTRKSRIYLRIYDKALEQGELGTWIRYELEIKKERAEMLSKIIDIENTGKLFCGILNNYITFLEPHKTDTNKSRWETLKEWEKLIGNAEKISLTNAPKIKDIEDTKNWIERQVSTSLALLMVHYEGDTGPLISIINQGYNKLKAKHFKKLIPKRFQNIAG